MIPIVKRNPLIIFLIVIIISIVISATSIFFPAYAIWFAITSAVILILSLSYYYFLIHKPLKVIIAKGLTLSRGNFSEQMTSIKHARPGSLWHSFDLIAQSIENIFHQEREAAASSIRTKSIFLANMSHEIRTPLNSINGFIRLLKETKLDSKQFDYLAIISKSSEDLMGIINDILIYSKIESSSVEIDRSAFNPFFEFESVINLVSIKAWEKNINFSVYLDPSLPGKLLGDYARIKQVLTNLLSNAVKFTHNNGTISVRIESKEVKDQTYEVLFQVSDNGIGISPDKIERIFHPFTQEDSSVGRKFGGTGLGLAISTNLVNLMGGELKVDSTKGEGSTFYFTLELTSEENHHSYRLDKYIKKVLIAHYPQDTTGEYLRDVMTSFGLEAHTISSLPSPTGPYDIIINLSTTEDFHRELHHFFPRTPFIHCQVDRQKGSLCEKASRVIEAPATPHKLYTIISEILSNADPKSGSPQKSDKPTTAYQFRGKVLIAEDSIPSQILMKEICTNMGIDFTLARNGLEALEKQREEEFHCIVMDINMPIMDGIEAAETIRTEEISRGLKHTPIAALTARLIKPGEGDEELAHFDHILLKPFTIQELAAFFSLHLKQEEEEEIESHKEPVPETFQETFIEENAQRLGVTEDFYLKSLGSFFHSVKDDLTDLQGAADRDDRETIRIISHKVKGTALTLGLSNIGEILLKLEKGHKTLAMDELEKLMKSCIELITGRESELLI